MFFNPGNEATYLIPFDGKDDSSDATYFKDCVPIGSGVAYRYSYDTLDYRTKAITHPMAGESILDYFSEFNRRAFDDECEGVLFWFDGDTHTCPLSRVFSKAPPPFCFCASAAGSKHYDCSTLNWLDVYKACKDRGCYAEGGLGLIPVKTNRFFPEVYMRAADNYYADYDSWGLQDGQWLREYIRDDIGSFSPEEFIDKGVTINGAKASSALE